MFLFLLMCFDVILQNESRRASRRMKDCRSTCRKLQSEITLILRINIALMFLYHHCRGDAPGSLLTCGFMQLFSSVRVSREDTVYIHLLFTPHASCVIHTVAAHIYNIVLLTIQDIQLSTPATSRTNHGRRLRHVVSFPGRFCHSYVHFCIPELKQ